MNKNLFSIHFKTTKKTTKIFLVANYHLILSYSNFFRIRTKSYFNNTKANRTHVTVTYG